ncbi:MAG: hypothetical protein WBO04_01895 [Steroidobacteraceae bacterium]
MGRPDPRSFWQELLRRRVVRAALYYVAGAWVLAQALDLLLDAFEALVLGLPVANLGNEPSNEYFSDGLAEEIRKQLARVPGLRVAARSSSFAFKGRHEDVREIGRRLGVASVLEGGVRKHAGMVRIDVQLVNAVDGYQVWSETFERQLDDIFKLQTEVACAVIEAVRPRAAGAERPRLEPATHSFDAYNLYLLGRHHFHKRNEAALRRAMDYFRQAIELDAGYALAYTGLADAYTLASTGYYGDIPARESIANALPAVERALELAPMLAEAHASLGLIRHDQGDYAAAIEIDPAFQVPYSGMARLNAMKGSLEEALGWIDRAIERAPTRAFHSRARPSSWRSSAGTKPPSSRSRKPAATRPAMPTRRTG